ncbi:EAL domain-containing protein [Halioxenophilus sp. WMMB6]|uniref:EAL domain-containing protein n=1 Tax=Halioxenophilus sp. WMMB6 TaxID=3073815 RepID=UPI00295E5CED|nr:EAL domain-containing protein [Halioxenophilus sp. WMMB6]
MSSRNAATDNIDEFVVKNLIKNEDFFLVYQKKVSIGDPSEVVGMEGLLRLKTKGFESQSPLVFLPVFKRMGLFPTLTLSMIDKLVGDWKSCSTTGLEPNITINIDLALFEDLAFIDKLLARLERSSMPLAKLTVDIIESSTLQALERAQAGLSLLKGAGSKLAIEATGNAELLENWPERNQIDEIKLPRFFFGDPQNNLENRAHIQRYRAIADSINAELTAVGVESAEETNYLASLGVNSAQGFMFGRPSPLSAMDQNSHFACSYNLDCNIVLVEHNLGFRGNLVSFLPHGFRVTTVNGEHLSADEIIKLNADLLIFEVDAPDNRAFQLLDDLSTRDDFDGSSTLVVAKSDDKNLYLRCYEAGVYAFIHQSMPVMETLAIINRSLNARAANRKISQMAKSSSELAMQSMRDAANYGEIVQLMKAICAANDEQEISKALFRYMHQHNLLASVVFFDGDRVTSYDSKHIHCRPTELNVFEVLRDKGRLYEFGNRIVVNGKLCSFLIKNLPQDPAEKGQIRDYVAAIIECMDARYECIIQASAIERAVEDLMSISLTAVTQVEASSNLRLEMIDTLNTEIGLSFHLLDLTIEQENYLKNLVSKFLNEHSWQEDASSHLVERLQTTVEHLSLLTKHKEPATVAGDDNLDDDVELF